MHLADINIFNFRNYESLAISFSSKINCIVGANGSGKTNLLDTIYYLSLTKSAFNSNDNQCLRHEQPAFSIKGTFEIEEEEHEVRCGFKAGQKKVIAHNNSEYERISEHIGKFPVVLIAPNDTDIIRDYSDARRKFFDGILCQMDADYLHELLTYSRILRQRNSLLKQSGHESNLDKTLLDTYDIELLKTGNKVFDKRQKFVEEYRPALASYYQKLSAGKEPISIAYQSQMSESDFAERYEANLPRDLVYGRTGYGVHKDDFIFEIAGHKLKRFGSQGQQKSFVIGLKLAQYSMMFEEKQRKPILLLDDIFDKLDDDRMSLLLELVSGDDFGQIFITDAREDRTTRLLTENQMTAQVMRIANNEVLLEH